MHSASAGPGLLLHVAESMSALRVIEMAPPGQVAETIRSPGLQVRSQLLLAPRVQPGGADRAGRALRPDRAGIALLAGGARRSGWSLRAGRSLRAFKASAERQRCGDNDGDERNTHEPLMNPDMNPTLNAVWLFQENQTE